VSEPPIIGSGKPHTVTLAEGSSVATQRPTRAAGGRLPEEPPAPVREGLAPEPAMQATRKAAQLRPSVQAAHVITPRAAQARPPSGIEDTSPLLARIAQVEQRNGRIRARLAQAGRSADKAGTEPR
jgi:hypothetical protein